MVNKINAIATNSQYKYSGLTGKIINACFQVHNTLGNGFQELIYQKALAIELKDNNLSFSREHEMTINYKGKKVDTRSVDLFIEDKIMVKIKAVIKLEDIYLAQAINYLEAYKLEVGLLINFGAKSLEFKRLMKRKNQQP